MQHNAVQNKLNAPLKAPSSSDNLEYCVISDEKAFLTCLVAMDEKRETIASKLRAVYIESDAVETRDKTVSVLLSLI